MEMCCVRVEQSVLVQWKINSTELLIRRRLNIYISNRLTWLSGFSKSLIVKWANFCDMRRRWLFYTIDFGSAYWLQMFSKEFRTNAWLQSDGFSSFDRTPAKPQNLDKKVKTVTANGTWNWMCANIFHLMKAVLVTLDYVFATLWTIANDSW